MPVIQPIPRHMRKNASVFKVFLFLLTFSHFFISPGVCIPLGWVDDALRAIGKSVPRGAKLAANLSDDAVRLFQKALQVLEKR